ncbi:MAG: glycosyltransferase family 4 protein [Bacteroidetes bacterium]|nr:glycosyltransferase family 4 protein [Bacteroidota bacterium]MCW5896101.1 glycosyltransferase family 4 protein [Bacteroidota bacterium]
MRLLVVDHNALEPANRVLYKMIVERGGVNLRLVVPAKWFNTFRTITFDPPTGELNYELFSSKVVFSGRTHRLMYRSLRRHIREFRPDVFYMHSEPENFAAFAAASLTPSSTKLVFYTARNIDHIQVGYPYKLSRLHKSIEQFVLPRASHGIACNCTARTLFAAYGFPHVSVIPLAVDTQLFRPAKAHKHDRAFVIGYVGRLERAKGVDLVLRALKHLPDLCVARIVGGGSELDNLKHLASSLGISDRVEFIPTLDRSSLPGELARFDVLVLPSRSTPLWKEQFGRVLIESMACGVPVLGSDSGEIPHVIGDAGLVFKEDSLDGLVLGCERLLVNEQLRGDLGRRGRERVERLYSLEVVATQHHKLFTSL